VLADAAGEYQRVEAAGCHGELADHAGRTVAEQFDGFLGRFLIRFQQRPHVLADAGYAKQA
jgi:hypothetical protein